MLFQKRYRFSLSDSAFPSNQEKQKIFPGEAELPAQP
jgi:hypothetical protein